METVKTNHLPFVDVLTTIHLFATRCIACSSCTHIDPSDFHVLVISNCVAQSIEASDDLSSRLNLSLPSEMHQFYRDVLP
ncbi:hypothetical protein P692DRAFT_20359263 [Suillus brevipes Sb2]|nr:hypothetical protein P692DRAFT_20359263 [Suillus brevipes Sb2]